MKVAIIGSGIAGISAAHYLSKSHEVVLFEKESRIGGHTNTISVRDEMSGEDLQVDTGFIVLNDKNYPTLHDLFKEWGVKVRWSDMSFSFYNSVTGYYYAGTTIFGLFPEFKLLFSKSHIRLLKEIYEFGKRSIAYLQRANAGDMTLGEYLKKEGYSRSFIANYLLPMGSAIWSVPTGQILEFPLTSFLNFFKNHGLLDIKDRPRWQTVVGGSSAYLSKFRDQFTGQIISNDAVVNVERAEDIVTIVTKSGARNQFEKVVFACHADQVLDLIADPTPQEITLYEAWKYEENVVQLHTDASLMPPRRVSWASWNYHSNEDSHAKLTYYMNKLQGLSNCEDYFVTLNCKDKIKRDKVIKEIIYHHPIYSREISHTQSMWDLVQGKKHSYFVGSYWGNGFHEDAAFSSKRMSDLFYASHR